VVNVKIRLICLSFGVYILSLTENKSLCHVEFINEGFIRGLMTLVIGSSNNVTWTLN